MTGKNASSGSHGEGGGCFYRPAEAFISLPSYRLGAGGGAVTGKGSHMTI